MANNNDNQNDGIASSSNGLVVMKNNNGNQNVGIASSSSGPVPMTNNGGNQNGGIASSSRGLGNLVNTEDANMDVLFSNDEIHEVPVEEEGFDGAGNLQAGPSNPPAATDNRRKRKYYYRHTQYQIKEMEAYYNICPHPDENQRRELAGELGLHPSQVKFWFQNKRTQMKTQLAHIENCQLRAENKHLFSENIKLKEKICLCVCYRCGRHVAMIPSQTYLKLRMENQMLRNKIEQVKAMIENFRGNIGKSIAASSSANPPFSYFNNDFYKAHLEFGVGESGGLVYKGNNIPSRDMASSSASTRRNQLLYNNAAAAAARMQMPMVMELAVSAMQEVDAMARIGEPLWINPAAAAADRKDDYRNVNVMVLNQQEYLRVFQRKFGQTQQEVSRFRCESSRATAVLIMNPLHIVQIFMEMNKFGAVFSGIISNATLLEVISTGVAAGNYHGTLQLISVKFQALSPAIPTRDCVFVRYCKQLNEITWAVADVSIDALLPNGPFSKCQRKPSGFIVQAMPNDCSKIIWVEHVEVQDNFENNLSRSIIKSGNAYGAKRWVSVLERQCQRLASAMGTKDFPYLEDLNDIVLGHPEGKKCVLNLAERMMLSFYGGITASPSNEVWTTVSGNGVDDIRIMTRKSNRNDLGCPNGIVISASFCLWLPVLPSSVFNYLRSEKTRHQWDILSRRGGVQEMAYIGNGQEKTNCVSILRVKNPHVNHGSMMMLQECSSEATASIIVYAPVEISSINNVLRRGGNPDLVELLPSGFTILPTEDNGITNGTLLSVAFQILGDSTSDLQLTLSSIATVKDLVKNTIRIIQISVHGI